MRHFSADCQLYTALLYHARECLFQGVSDNYGLVGEISTVCQYYYGAEYQANSAFLISSACGKGKRRFPYNTCRETGEHLWQSIRQQSTKMDDRGSRHYRAAHTSRPSCERRSPPLSRSLRKILTSGRRISSSRTPPGKTQRIKKRNKACNHPVTKTNVFRYITPEGRMHVSEGISYFWKVTRPYVTQAAFPARDPRRVFSPRPNVPVGRQGVE